MEEISELIVELLKTHNRVSLPGMGAFMATPQAAIINKETKTITPPSKKITFSKTETWNDGFLEQLYAERKGVSIDEARDRLRHIIIDVRFELDATGKVTLPGLGTLKQTQARDISFGLSKNVNLKGDSFGLGEVKIEPGAGAFKHGSGKQSSFSYSKNNLPLLILLGVMVVIISALLLYLFLAYRGSNEESWMTPVEQNAAAMPAQVQPQQPVGAAAQPQQEPHYIVHTPQQPAKTQPQPAASSPRCEHCIVATSLSTNEGAQHKAEQYRKLGYKSGVVNSGNNRYRVTLGCYRSSDAAKQELRKTQKFIKDAWVLEVCK